MKRFTASPAAHSAGLRQWIVAGSLAFALHAGAAAMLFMGGETADSDDNLGAMAMEVGIENAAPSFDSTELPADSDAASAIAAAATNEIAAAPPAPTPPASTEQSEAQQQTATTSREQTEQTDRVVEAAASTAAAPSVSASAPSRAAEQESVRSVAAAIGSSAKAQRAKAAWQRGLVAHIERQKRYPATGAEQLADIVVSFTINRRGSLTAVQIAKGSGDARFDQAALEMIRRADPLPPPPPFVNEQNLSFRIPISFRPGG
ncbi:MAG: energy transducer TonB [Rhizobiales bacterium]|nr:energy transducer TonB [Hyphomicrobiales bacterium]